VERKMGTSAFGQLTINATEWMDAEWAQKKGLYNGVYDTVEAMDEAIMELAKKLAGSNPEAMAGLKKALWEGTEHWDELLMERAVMSGKLVLSEFTANAIAKFKTS